MKPQELPPERRRLVTMLKALSNPARYKIVEYLAQCPQCIVSDIVDQTPLAQSTVSGHLKVLRDAGIIRGEIEGPAMNYCLDPKAMEWLASEVTKLVETLCGPGCCRR